MSISKYFDFFKRKKWKSETINGVNINIQPGCTISKSNRNVIEKICMIISSFSGYYLLDDSITVHSNRRGDVELKFKISDIEGGNKDGDSDLPVDLEEEIKTYVRVKFLELKGYYLSMDSFPSRGYVSFVILSLGLNPVS